MKAERAPRSDKGDIRLTQRDVEVMTFLSDQYGLRKDQLPQLVGDVSERTSRALIDRWVRGGLVYRRTIFAGEHAWLWPTRAGLSLAPFLLPYGSRARASWSTSIGSPRYGSGSLSDTLAPHGSPSADFAPMPGERTAPSTCPTQSS